MVRPRAENYQERKDEILDCAASMFAERGFDATAISSIAIRCGVSKALLYHYYSSKEELLYNMLLSHCTKLVEVAHEAVRSGDSPEKRLKSLARELMHLYETSRDKHVVLLNNLHTLPEEQQQEIKGLERQVVGLIKGILKELRPDLPPRQVSALSMYVMGAINWTYTWFKPEGALTSGSFANLSVDVFCRGILNVQADPSLRG